MKLYTRSLSSLTGAQISWCTAFHEAGHVVAHVRAGAAPYEVSIVPSGDTLGHYRPVLADVDDVAGHLVMLLAGWAAERRIGLQERVAADGARADFREARSLVRRTGAGTLERWLSEAEAFVGRTRNWKAIESVAGYLRKRRTVRGEELETLIHLADGKSAEAEARRKEALVSRVNRGLENAPSFPGLNARLVVASRDAVASPRPMTGMCADGHWSYFSGNVPKRCSRTGCRLPLENETIRTVSNPVKKP